MGTCHLVLSSTFNPRYDRYINDRYRILNDNVCVMCDGEYFTDLDVREVKIIDIEPGSHLFQFEVVFRFTDLHDGLVYIDGEGDFEYDPEVFFSSRVVNLPAGERFVLLEDDLMRQFEKWRDNIEKESEEFLREMDECNKQLGEALGDYIKKKYHK